MKSFDTSSDRLVQRTRHLAGASSCRRVFYSRGSDPTRDCLHGLLGPIGGVIHPGGKVLSKLASIDESVPANGLCPPLAILSKRASDRVGLQRRRDLHLRAQDHRLVYTNAAVPFLASRKAAAGIPVARRPVTTGREETKFPPRRNCETASIREGRAPSRNVSSSLPSGVVKSWTRYPERRCADFSRCVGPRLGCCIKIDAGERQLLGDDFWTVGSPVLGAEGDRRDRENDSIPSAWPRDWRVPVLESTGSCGAPQNKKRVIGALPNCILASFRRNVKPMSVNIPEAPPTAEARI
jgi:hypothetical protein